MRLQHPSLSKTLVLVSLLLGLPCLSAAHAAPLTTYSDEAAFKAAIGASYTSENFDEFASGTLLTTQVSGVTFSSPLSGVSGYLPIQAFGSPGAISTPNSLAGGFVSGSPGLGQTIVLDFLPDVTAFGFWLSPLTPNSIVVSVRVDFRDGSSQTLTISDKDSNGTEFLGFRSTARIRRISFESANAQGGQDGFKQFGVDNLTWAAADLNPPVCSAVKSLVDGLLFFTGTATDNAPFDTGIVSVTLNNSTNVTLTCDSPFPASCGIVATPTPISNWRVVPTDVTQSGEATVLAADAAGHTCSFAVNFVAFGGGSVVDLPVCSADGVALTVTNPGAAPGGQVVCGSNLPGPGDPSFPPGYESTPADDPFPCVVSTIKSPISGSTEMTIVKDGPFEPRLRMLFSRFNGTIFPVFTDITTSVYQIVTVIPDPTGVKGTGTWSQVKVTCAVLSETCNGVDDDGDGLIDEGFPVGGAARDCDGDGFPMCPTAETTAVTCAGGIVNLVPGATSDCNDQIGAIHAGAAELCNGMDDDCDGSIDEGIGTISCGVGACARTIEACVDHLPQTCTPGTPGTETCNGIDDDCDGSTDEGLGQTTCGTGTCARTVNTCAGGVTQTCTPGTPGTETCNGLDDDCDGAVDEALAFNGYMEPVNNDGSSIFQQKSTIPFKFRLATCAGATPAPVTATIEVTFYASGIRGTELEVVPINTKADTGTTYRYDARGNQYIFNFSTKNLAPNATYRVRTRIAADGSVHDVLISLK